MDEQIYGIEQPILKRGYTINMEILVAAATNLIPGLFFGFIFVNFIGNNPVGLALGGFALLLALLSFLASFAWLLKCKKVMKTLNETAQSLGLKTVNRNINFHQKSPLQAMHSTMSGFATGVYKGRGVFIGNYTEGKSDPGFGSQKYTIVGMEPKKDLNGKLPSFILQTKNVFAGVAKLFGAKIIDFKNKYNLQVILDPSLKSNEEELTQKVEEVLNDKILAEFDRLELNSLSVSFDGTIYAILPKLTADLQIIQGCLDFVEGI